VLPKKDSQSLAQGDWVFFFHKVLRGRSYVRSPSARLALSFPQNARHKFAERLVGVSKNYARLP